MSKNPYHYRDYEELEKALPFRAPLFYFRVGNILYINSLDGQYEPIPIKEGNYRKTLLYILVNIEESGDKYSLMYKAKYLE